MADGDIAKIIAQEQGLVFEAFSEDTAFAIGAAIRSRAVSEMLSVVVEIKL